MTPDIMFGLFAAILSVVFALAAVYHAHQATRHANDAVKYANEALEAREKMTKQLLDRLATHEYAKGDPAIPRIFATMPPSVKEEQVSGPHGKAFNTVARQTNLTLEAELARRKAGRKTQKLKLDTADEFDRKPE